MPKLTDLYAGAELVTMLRTLAQRGFTLRWRVIPKAKAGGAWVAQVSRDGHYIRAQQRHPAEAVGRLIDRLRQAEAGSSFRHRWQAWRRRPWKPDG